MLIKSTIIAFGLFIITCQKTSAQVFFRDYEIFLEGLQIKNHSTKNKGFNSTKQQITRLKDMFKDIKAKRNICMLSSDTLFMVSYRGLETSRSSMLVWNKINSCYYDYTFELQHWKIANEKFEIENNATKILNALRPDFKKWVETSDTLSYNIYGKSHPVYDGSAVMFTVATKIANHWRFVSSKSYTTLVDQLRVK